MKRSIKRFKESYLFYSFKHDKTAMISFFLLACFIILSITAPLVSPFNPYDAKNINIINSEIPPMWLKGGTSTFILGTDNMGRDLLSTMIYGLRISVIIGICAVAL